MKLTNKQRNWISAGIMLMCAIICSWGIWNLASLSQANLPKVEVNGQMCDLEWKQDGQTSHGATWGHYVARCEK